VLLAYSVRWSHPITGPPTAIFIAARLIKSRAIADADARTAATVAADQTGCQGDERYQTDRCRLPVSRDEIHRGS
jgi:hypothetical protein